MSLLFDKSVDRTNADAADYLEPHYTYLNRSGRELFNEARIQLDNWYEKYVKSCPDEAGRLKNDFCSTDDQRHLSAYTELYTHHLLIENGFEIECHPAVSRSSHRPEFLVKKNGQGLFYVECKAMIGSADSVRNKKWENEILDAINQINSPDFLVSMEIRRSDSVNPPKSGRLREYLQKQIDNLNYNTVCKEYEKTQALPSFAWKPDNWNISFSPSPVEKAARQRRGKDSRVVGAYSSGVRWIRLHQQIQKAIERKATKYGLLPLPYLIVLNVIGEHFFLDDSTAMDALFGEEQVNITSFIDGSHTRRWGRTLKGAFTTPTGPRNTRVSGVLMLEDSMPWYQGKSQKTWLHPFAAQPFDVSWLDLPYKIHNKETGRMEDWSNPDI